MRQIIVNGRAFTITSKDVLTKDVAMNRAHNSAPIAPFYVPGNFPWRAI